MSSGVGFGNTPAQNFVINTGAIVGGVSCCVLIVSAFIATVGAKAIHHHPHSLFSRVEIDTVLGSVGGTVAGAVLVWFGIGRANATDPNPVPSKGK